MTLGYEAAGEVVEVAQLARVNVAEWAVVMPSFACGQYPLCLRPAFPSPSVCCWTWGHQSFVAEAADLTLNVSQDLLRKGLTQYDQ